MTYGVTGAAGEPVSGIALPSQLGVLVVVDEDLPSISCPDGCLSPGNPGVVLTAESGPFREIGGLLPDRVGVDEIRVGEGCLDDRDPGRVEIAFQGGDGMGEFLIVQLQVEHGLSDWCSGSGAGALGQSALGRDLQRVGLQLARDLEDGRKPVGHHHGLSCQNSPEREFSRFDAHDCIGEITRPDLPGLGPPRRIEESSSCGLLHGCLAPGFTRTSGGQAVRSKCGLILLAGIPQIKPTFLDIAPAGIPRNIIPHSKGVKCGLMRPDSLKVPAFIGQPLYCQA